MGGTFPFLHRLHCITVRNKHKITYGHFEKNSIHFKIKWNSWLSNCWIVFAILFTMMDKRALVIYEYRFQLSAVYQYRERIERQTCFHNKHSARQRLLNQRHRIRAKCLTLFRVHNLYLGQIKAQSISCFDHGFFVLDNQILQQLKQNWHEYRFNSTL